MFLLQKMFHCSSRIILCFLAQQSESILVCTRLFFPKVFLDLSFWTFINVQFQEMKKVLKKRYKNNHRDHNALKSEK